MALRRPSPSPDATKLHHHTRARGPAVDLDGRELVSVDLRPPGAARWFLARAREAPPRPCHPCHGAAATLPPCHFGPRCPGM